jgi:hypothetical protein
MTPEERDIVGRFIARVGGAQQGGFSGASSVPATQTALPPIDPEADRFIADQFNANPQARYRITQMAFVQEAALAEAQNRIKRLEYDLQQAQQALQQAQSQGGQRSGGGLFSGLFGGGQPQPPRPAYQPQYAPPPPQPSYPPGYQPGMFRSGGSGFLGSALTTAAGVAGGVLAADALTSMFSGHGMGGGFGGGGFGGGGFGGGEVVNETVVNNYGTDAAADPWAGGGTAPDAPASGWSGGDSGGSDAWSGSGDPAGGGDWGGGDSGGGWDDNSGGGDGGF